MCASRRSNPPRSLLSTEQLFLDLPPSRRALRPEEIHRLRRSAKRARAVLRLAEDAGRVEARRVRHAISAAMKPLGPLRDATVVRRVADKFGARLKSAASAPARTVGALPEPNPKRRWWTEEWRRLARARRLLAVLDHQPFAESKLRRALACAVRRLRKRAKHAAKHRDDIQRAHRWRKSVIVLRDELEILAPGHRRIAKVIKHLKYIGRVLGRAVDYTVFLGVVQRHDWPPSQQKGAKALIRIAEEKRWSALRHARAEWTELKSLLSRVKRCAILPP